MDQPLTSIGVSVFATIITILLTFIVRGIVAISKEQVEQGLKINTLTLQVSDVILRVDKIHEWRNKLAEADIASYKQLIHELQSKKDV